MSPVSRLLITTFGLGYLRPAPGTWGSVPTAVLAAALVWFGYTGTTTWFAALALTAAAFSVICVLCGHGAEAAFGKKDPSQAVADETAGMAITLLLLPLHLIAPDTATLIFFIGVAFVAFRVADIIKPWPSNTLQRLPAGWGILVDDLVAGAQAAVPVWVLAYFLPHDTITHFLFAITGK